jgi:carbonic anhydrase/acetyltransferase-like protein (isoleucine patch superfamily)
MIYAHGDVEPNIDLTVFIAESADVIGQVEIGRESSIWFQSVIRGDVEKIQIGERSNIQDRCVLHVTRGDASLRIGDEVTVGHGAILHGCHVADRCLIGMGAILMDHVKIGEGSMVAAGALVPPHKEFPPNSLILGHPAQRVREVRSRETAWILESSKNYVQDAKKVFRAMR